MQAGRILKDGNTCYVSRFLWNGQDVVVKRYNHKGFWHSLRHTLKGSRARRNWLHAHRLLWIKISTPAPLAYIEEYAGPLLWRSYFITRFVSAPTLRRMFRDQQVPVSQKQQIHEAVLRTLHQMAEEPYVSG